MTVWWPDTAVEYVGLVIYVVLAGAFVYWLSGVDTNTVMARLFRETANPQISEYVECEDPTRCRREMCETCMNGRMAYIARGGGPERWPLLMEETRARWRREARPANQADEASLRRPLSESVARGSDDCAQHADRAECAESEQFGHA